MRSTPAVEDLTARSRILSAAVERFARSGLTAGLRAVAEDAGVSAGLVVHHFGSKQGLREACDEHVLRVIREQKTEAMTTADPGPLMARMAGYEDYAPLALYVLRTLQSGGPSAASFLEHFVADAEGYLAAGVAAGRLRPSRDPAARARHLTYTGLGAVLVQLTVEGIADDDDIRGLFRRAADATALPALELYTQGLFTDRSMLDAYLEHVSDPPHGTGSP